MTKATTKRRGINWRIDGLTVYQRMQRAAMENNEAADRDRASRAEIVAQHRATCGVCIGGGDCAGPFGDWHQDY